MKNKKINHFKKAVGKENLKKLPIYYNVIEERPPQTEIHVVYSQNHEGSFFLSGAYYKPISRILV